jgi:hypothetical protein
MNKLLLAALGLILVSSNAVAVTGWAGPRTILALEANANGTEIRLAGFGGGCTELNEGGVDKTWTRIGIADTNNKQLLALAYLAFSTGKMINAYCSDNAPWTNVSNIQMIN